MLTAGAAPDLRAQIQAAFEQWTVRGPSFPDRIASRVRERVQLCAEHVRQFEGESPLPNLMEVKG